MNDVHTQAVKNLRRTSAEHGSVGIREANTSCASATRGSGLPWRAITFHKTGSGSISPGMILPSCNFETRSAITHGQGEGLDIWERDNPWAAVQSAAVFLGPVLLEIETPEPENENNKVGNLAACRTHRDSNPGQHVIRAHVILVAFLYPAPDQRSPGIPRHSLLLNFGTSRLPSPDESFPSLLNLVCELALGVDIIVREGAHWRGGSDGVAAFRSDWGRAEGCIIRDLCSHGL